MRKIPCPYCKGEVLSEQNGKTSSSAALFPRLQNVLLAISEMISAILGGPKTVSKLQALGGECRTCKGSGEIEDVTDTTEQDQAAAEYLDGKKDRILELEKKLGNSPGGSMVTRVANTKIDIIGRTFNSASSYTVHKGKGTQPVNGKVTKEGRASVQEGPEKGEGNNVITGNNVPANSGGGLYYIQCGNKFKLAAGSQGIDLTSPGPINIDGGQVRFTGAEVTIGTRTGTTVLEGEQTIINSTGSIILSPGQTGTPKDSEGKDNKTSKANCILNSSLSIGANLKVGGLYADCGWFSTLTMPEKQETTKVGSQTDLIGGPAQWGPGTLPPIALKNFIKWVLDSTSDIVLAGAMSPLNPRSMLKIKDNAVNLVYSGLTLELVPTGICICPTGVGVVYNFPHTHTTPDEAHSHNYSVPAINYKGHTAESIRGEADAAGINSTIPATGAGGGGDYLGRVVSGIGGLFKAITGVFATDGHKISGGGG